MGSGTMLKYAFVKYGVENFPKEILSFHNSLEELYEAEAAIVNQEFVDRSDTYNMKTGGAGGCGLVHKEESRLKMSVRKGIPVSTETRAKMSAAAKRRRDSAETKQKKSLARLGHQYSEETKRKLSIAQSLHQAKIRSISTVNQPYTL